MSVKVTEIAGRFGYDYEGPYIDSGDGYFLDLGDFIPEGSWGEPGPRGRFRITIEWEPE